jgi:UDP-N-acetylglucosamine 1-carboxyvinyltransferase
MGAAITSMNPREVLIKGKTPLKALDAGEELVSYDIRAGFAIIIAALIAQGTSVIDNTYFIDRGYEKIEKRLKALGADIVRIAAE